MNFKHICKVFCGYFGPDEGVSSGSKLCLTSVEYIDLKTGAYQGTSWLIAFFFPTCQVRVVRFYQSCSSPPRLALLLLLLLLFLLVLLLVLLLLSASSSFSSTVSASTSTSTSALPTLRQALRQLPSSVRTAGPQPGTIPAQCAPLDLNLGPSQLQCAPLDLNLGPSQLSVHRWTSTWDLPSSVWTAGPQPGTFRAQCAPLDLNLGPFQLSVHRWTSTWDLPNSIIIRWTSTAR